MTPYGIQSDTHCHSWSAFSETLDSGINSRLQIILDEAWRLASAIKKIGGKTMYHTGDLFHVRGSIAPSVLNPTLDVYRKIKEELGIEVRILAGNHDLENRDAQRLSSAITALEGIGCVVVNEPTSFDDDKVLMIQWIQNIQDLKSCIEAEKDILESKGCNVSEWTLMIHAPVDGVIVGLPDHGLDDKYLSQLGFKYVFCGHYHHHKDFGNGVYSVGASTQQTWSDVGSNAGFLLVTKLGVKWMKSRAPEFVEVNGDMSSEDIKNAVAGNYVRAKINTDKSADVESVRSFLIENEAKGVVILTTKTAIEAERSTTSVKVGASIEESVNEFIKNSTVSVDHNDLSVLCNSILAEARLEVSE